MAPAGAVQQSALLSFDAWQQFVNAGHAPPPSMPSQAALKKMSPTERALVAEQRAEWNAQPHIAGTPELQQLEERLRRQNIMNRHQKAARGVVIVDGPTHVGKTTALLHVGRRLHREIVDATEAPRPADAEPGQVVPHHIPIVLTSVTEGPTAKKVTWKLADFMNLIDSRTVDRRNQSQLASAISHQAAISGTQYIVIDEFHFLGSTRDSSEAMQAIKDFMNTIPATFVLSGINVVEDTLRLSDVGQEILRRAKVVRFRPWGYKTKEQRAAWNSLILEFEQPLLLAGKQRGDIEKHADLIHQKVLGYPGAAGNLVRELALDAVLDGTERITKAAIEAVEPPELDDNYD